MAQFVATESGTFHAALPNQTPVSIGTLTVVGTPTSSIKKTTAPPPTSTSPHPTTKVTTSASTSASARKKKTATPTITRSNPAIVLPDSPWETGTLSGEAPAPSDVGGSTDPGIPLSNEVTHGSGGVSPPLGLVLVSVIVIAGLLGAVVRMIIVHTRAQAGPTR
ncbi:MAG TPA: hypothetical protein VJ831_08235 [Jatrophihabitantaceae bacterium]|nr:hypothetical protein [Jatrophihabitantaceae bacterium]